MTHPQAARPHGFTLLELLVVLTILALLGVAAPRLMPSEGSKLRETAEELVSTLRNLRARAIRQGAPATFQPLENGYRLDTDTKTHPLPKGIALHLQDTAPNLLGLQGKSLRFFADGSATGGSLSLTSRRATIRISVTWMDGQVHLDE